MTKQTALQRIQVNSDRLKVNAWLDSINCTNKAERQEVLDMCAADIEARKYYVMRYETEVSKNHGQ